MKSKTGVSEYNPHLMEGKPLRRLRLLPGFLREMFRQFCVGADNWFFETVVGKHWMNLGKLMQYAPTPIQWGRLESIRPACETPKLLLVTPSLNQGRYLGRTIRSVVEQEYEKLIYVLKDGGSSDNTFEEIRKNERHLHSWVSARDEGQASAINEGFEMGCEMLGPDDIMAWINADDIFAPGAFHFVANYFARNPSVDVVYGNRIIIDTEDREIGRWVLPPHCERTIRWVDYIPQETMFWRKRIWDAVGGVDHHFQFAMDWDLICRFADAGAKFVRLPHFLAAFRVHQSQKTSSEINELGAYEMEMIRSRMRPDEDYLRINRKMLFRASIYSRLLDIGVRLW